MTRLRLLVMSVVVLAGCGGGGLSSDARNYCDLWFGNVIGAGMTLNNLPPLPADIAGTADWNMLSTWASMAGGTGQYGAMYGQQIREAQSDWESQHADTYAAACSYAYSHYGSH